LPPPPSGPARGYRPFEPVRLVFIAIAIPCASFLLSSFASIAALQAIGVDASAIGGSGDPDVDLVLEISSCLFEVLLLGLSVAVVWRRETPWTGHAIAWTPWRKDRSFLPFLGLMLAWLVVEGFLIEPRFPYLADLTRLPTDGSAVLVALIAAVISPIAEEVFFRGFLFTNLRVYAGYATTIIVTAAYFALLHFASTLVLPLLVLPFGLILGLVRERYASIRPAIYLHLIWNLVAFGIDYFYLAT
jgi:membrane protease YdiL (CAAX protease family)